MTRVLPSSFLFRYSFAVPQREAAGAALPLNLPDGCRLPFPGVLDDRDEFSALKLAWNARGVAISVEVAGKRRPPQCDPRRPTESDGLQVWFDTRDTQTIHRASRFCHHFCVLPTGSGRRNREPAAIQLPIARAREDAPLVESAAIPTLAELRSDGYRLDVWIPAEALHGFDPEAVPRLGFYYLVRDSELGDQTLTVGEEFPYPHDPSVWSTLQLVTGARG
jgi:hypothetical protein